MLRRSGAVVLHGRRDAALALYRNQLRELARDRAEGRLQPPDHDRAVLDVQRRLLAAPWRERLAQAQAERQQAGRLIHELQSQIARFDPHSEAARQGEILLGSLQTRAGDMQAAADSLSRALAVRFDPTLAVETAEALTEAAGHVTTPSAALFQRALAAAPPDAPWRTMAERRLRQQPGS